MVPAAVILADAELVRLLAHLGLPTDYPGTRPARKLPAQEADEDLRAPPEDDGCQLDPHEALCGEIAPLVDDWAAAQIPHAAEAGEAWPDSWRKP